MSQRRLTARDYKSVRRGGLQLARWRDLGLGFGAGVLIALVVYVGDHRGTAGPADAASAAAPSPRHSGGKRADVAGADTPLDGSAGHSGNYDFYDGLPKFEVVVPEKEQGAHVDAAARVERPGTYFLQAGSYRNIDDANRVQAQLSRQNIAANVQRVALDTDVWYRIRIGPIKDLGQLNRVRQQLQAAEIVSLVIRVED